MVGVFVEGTVMLLCSTHLLFVTMAGFWMFLIACQYQKFAGTDARKGATEPWMANLLRFRPHPATSHRVFRTSNPRHGTKRRCVEHPANTPSPAPHSLLLHTLFLNCLPQPIQIRCPQRPVIQSISCSSGLAPYHSSMIGRI